MVALTLVVLTLTLWTHDTGRQNTGQQVRTLHTYGTAVAVTPDSRQIVTGTVDGTAQVWELPTT